MDKATLLARLKRSLSALRRNVNHGPVFARFAAGLGAVLDGGAGARVRSLGE